MVSSRRARLVRAGGVRAPQAYNGAVREQLSDLQRARIIGAMFDVATVRGAGSVTVAHVVERSGVSRRTFYEQFEDREDCLLAAFERALTLACERVIPAYEEQKGWRERMRAGLIALLALCDEQPTVARMLICESQASGPRVNERRAEVLGRLTRIVDQGRREGKSENVSSLAAEGIVGGVLAVIHARLFEEEHTQRAQGKPLSVLTNELVSMIVLPYLGGAAARRELDRPAPVPASARRGGDALLSDPFKTAGMRLTYRTVRVLMAIAQHPQASNRQIGEAAGIADQGQISKLLARLERIGLVSNTGIHPGKGAPNSWALTEQGERIAQSIRTNTEGSQSLGAQER
jgi:AcrR family transcriptional regulator